MRRFVLVTLLLGSFGFAGCFNPDRPSCSFVCSGSAPACPDQYECRADNYCHLIGNTDVCGFSDAATEPLDLSATPSDMLTATTDAGTTD
ncbi:MAG TPA: hypothetical protein VIA18_16795 [Polyangia bacterium]|jgi:hypothetical protein|nr:hypothetical protein [Polyangia bacterium]